MPPKKTKITHSQVVQRFASRLREVLLALGLTQAEVARRAEVTVNYVGRLEAAGAAPGIDLLGGWRRPSGRRRPTSCRATRLRTRRMSSGAKPGGCSWS